MPTTPPKFYIYLATQICVPFLLFLFQTSTKIRNKTNKQAKKQLILECVIPSETPLEKTHVSLCMWVPHADNFLFRWGIQCLHSHLSAETPSGMTLLRSYVCI